MNTLQKKNDKHKTHKILLGIYLSTAIIGSILLIIYDQSISTKLISIRKSSPFISTLSHFFDRSLFDGDRFGGQDPGYLLIIISLLLYIVSFIPRIKEKLLPYRKYMGFLLASILVLAIINRGFKVLFARARPGDVADDPTLYSAMWTFGKYSFSDALSKGSFTSGHTNMAIYLVSLAFISIRSKKRGIIIVSFTLTITYSILMAFSRVFEGDHYLSDGFWAILIGLIVISWIYFSVLNIPGQEEHKEFQLKYGQEFIWGLIFVLAFGSFVAGIISMRYMFINFQWYQPLITIGAILVILLANHLSNKILQPIQEL